MRVGETFQNRVRSAGGRKKKVVVIAREKGILELMRTENPGCREGGKEKQKPSIERPEKRGISRTRLTWSMREKKRVRGFGFAFGNLSDAGEGAQRGSRLRRARSKN